MILKIGNYALTQDIKYMTGLTEFSEEEYQMAEQFGMTRILEDEKMFNGQTCEFASIIWESVTIGTTKCKIYKIALQNNYSDKKIAKANLNNLVKFVNDEVGKYNEHPFLSDKYIWDTKEGNIIIYKISQSNFHVVNIILTSNIISEQILKLQNKA